MLRDNRESSALVSIFLDSMIHLIISLRTPLCAKGNNSLPRRWAKHETENKRILYYEELSYKMQNEDL